MSERIRTVRAASFRGRLSSKNHRGGAAIVEFALTFMLFLVLVLALMDLGRAIWTYTTISYAARQGARFAMVSGTFNPATAAEIETQVKANAIGLETSQMTVTTVWDPDGLFDPDFQKGSTVQVRVQYPFRMITSPIVITDQTITFQSTSRRTVVN